MPDKWTFPDVVLLAAAGRASGRKDVKGAVARAEKPRIKVSVWLCHLPVKGLLGFFYIQ